MRFLLDEMFPPATAGLLRGTGHAAEHVREVGLAGAPDDTVIAFARDHDAVVVTENVQDFAAAEDVVVVFVRKRTLPAGGAQAAALATRLDGWARDHPGPYRGPHWPT